MCLKGLVIWYFVRTIRWIAVRRRPSDLRIAHCVFCLLVYQVIGVSTSFASNFVNSSFEAKPGSKWRRSNFSEHSEILNYFGKGEVKLLTNRCLCSLLSIKSFAMICFCYCARICLAFFASRTTGNGHTNDSWKGNLLHESTSSTKFTEHENTYMFILAYCTRWYHRIREVRWSQTIIYKITLWKNMISVVYERWYGYWEWVDVEKGSVRRIIVQRYGKVQWKSWGLISLGVLAIRENAAGRRLVSNMTHHWGHVDGNKNDAMCCSDPRLL